MMVYLGDRIRNGEEKNPRKAFVSCRVARGRYPKTGSGKLFRRIYNMCVTYTNIRLPTSEWNFVSVLSDHSAPPSVPVGETQGVPSLHPLLAVGSPQHHAGGPVKYEKNRSPVKKTA